MRAILKLRIEIPLKHFQVNNAGIDGKLVKKNFFFGHCCSLSGCLEICCVGILISKFMFIQFRVWTLEVTQVTWWMGFFIGKEVRPEHTQTPLFLLWFFLPWYNKIKTHYYILIASFSCIIKDISLLLRWPNLWYLP